MYRNCLILLMTLSLSGSLLSQSQLHLTVLSDRVKDAKVSYESVAANKLRVVVIDSSGPVGGLAETDFAIRTDLKKGEIYKVQPLIQSETAKVSVVMCIDNSSSMAKHVGRLKETLNNLINSFGPSVKIASIFFMEGFPGHGDLPFSAPPNILIYSFTRDKEHVKNSFEERLSGSRLTGRTFLYDAIYTAINIMKLVDDPEEQKYVVVLSDGQDLGSHYNEAYVYDLAARNTDIVFYTIDFLQETNPFLLSLALQSNGRHFQAKKAQELSPIFEEISRDIQKLTGYLITYDLRLAYLAGCIRDGLSCEPIPRAEVIFYPSTRPEHRISATADESGYYRSPVAFPYDWVVRASAPDYMVDSTQVNVNQENVFLADIQLYPAYVSKRGRVLDLGTAPLAEAEVSVTDLISGEILFQGLTDSSGSYEFESRVGNNLLIAATKDGYTYGSVNLEKINRETLVPDIVLGLTAEGFVSEFRFLFEFDSDKLDLSDISTVSQLQGCVEFINRELEKSPTRTVRLVGWTDSLGTPEYNLDLSNRRANYVKGYLIEQGIPEHRIEAEGKGISYKYDNSLEEGRALNRRTDVAFFDKPTVTEKLPVQDQ